MYKFDLINPADLLKAASLQADKMDPLHGLHAYCIKCHLTDVKDFNTFSRLHLSPNQINLEPFQLQHL